MNQTSTMKIATADRADTAVSTAAVSLRDSLASGSAERVFGALSPLDAPQMIEALRAVGFTVDGKLSALGRGGIFNTIKADLALALTIRGDGYSVASHKASLAQAMPAQAPASGKAQEAMSPAAQKVQRFLNESAISVCILGEEPFMERDSLLMIAGQAMQKGILGFGFDGVPGKFEVPLGMGEIVELHENAAQSVAIESARAALQAWAAGERVVGVSEWVPDSVQRLLYAPVSLEAAQAVVHTIETGQVGKHAAEKGAYMIQNLLSDHGLDASAPTIEMQAELLGLSIQEADRERGRYFGTVVAQDHRATLLKNTRTTAIELPHTQLKEAQGRPALGDAVRLTFDRGDLSVSWSGRQVLEQDGR